MLEKVSYALANIRNPVVQECERFFGCQLTPLIQTSKNIQQFESHNLQWGVEHLDVRMGKNEGIIVASFKQALQQEFVKQLNVLGKIVKIDVVSPPINPLSSPNWTKKWSVAYTVLDTKIWFGLEERQEIEYLLFASRKFTLESSRLSLN